MKVPYDPYNYTRAATLKRQKLLKEKDNIESKQNNPRYRLQRTKYSINSFMRRPHTIILLTIVSLLLAYFAFTRDQTSGTVHNTRFGILAACGFFLFYSFLQMKDSYLYRPHPTVWRVVKGIAVLYLLFFVFLLFQTKDDARFFMKYLDSNPGVGEPREDKLYAMDCRIYTPEDSGCKFRNVRNMLFDEFIIAHVLGHFVKMLIIRDIKICMMISVIFELCEYIFQHMLPNFAECWWDRWILDLLVCNMLGMIAGYYFCKKFYLLSNYNWVGQSQENTEPQQKQRSWKKNIWTILSFQPFTWRMFSSWKRFLQVALIIYGFQVADLNSFFLKRVLFLPNSSYLNVARLVIWTLFANAALREIYIYISDRNVKKFGSMSWISVLILIVETLVVIKFSIGEFPVPMPDSIAIGLIVSFSLSILSLTYYFSFLKKRKRQKKKSI